MNYEIMCMDCKKIFTQTQMGYKGFKFLIFVRREEIRGDSKITIKDVYAPLCKECRDKR